MPRVLPNYAFQWILAEVGTDNISPVHNSIIVRNKGLIPLGS